MSLEDLLVGSDPLEVSALDYRWTGLTSRSSIRLKCYAICFTFASASGLPDEAGRNKRSCKILANWKAALCHFCTRRNLGWSPPLKRQPRQYAPQLLLDCRFRGNDNPGGIP